MIKLARRWFGGGMSFYWAFAALNFTVLLVGAGVLWGTGRLDRKKVSQLSQLIQAPVQPDEEPAPKASEPDLAALQTDEERSRWIGEAVVSLQEQRKRAAAQRAQYEAFLTEERRVLEAERDKLETRRKALELREKAFTENKKAWDEAQRQAGFKDLVAKLAALDDATKVAEILLGYTTEKIALYLAAFKQTYAAEVLGALQDALQAQGKEKMMREILRALEERKAPQGPANN